MHGEGCNRWWCAIVAAALHRHHCTDVIICPGNRDVPLIAHFVHDPRFHVASHLDERSAAFRALGMARASQRPAAVITTSGSAVANCLPALCEAFTGGWPLIVISADRPLALQNCGAPQTMPQAHIFRPMCRASVAAPDPAWAAGASFADELEIALSACRNGPLHLNLPFAEPLLGNNDQVLPELPQVRPSNPVVTAATSRHQDAHEILHTAQRGVIVCGPDNPIPEPWLRLACERGWPVIADAPGNLRRRLPPVIQRADAFLNAAGDPALTCDIILRGGPAPIARPVWEWLQAQNCPVLRWDRLPVDKDFCHPNFLFLGDARQPADEALWLSLPHLDPNWLSEWRQRDDSARQRLEKSLNERPWSERAAAAQACQPPTMDTPCHLQLANSLSVRHGNLLVDQRHDWAGVWAARGVNGIDGTLGTALGLCERLGPLRLLCGDLAFIHDLAALPAIAASAAPLQIVILDNGGGRIFDTLPIAQDPSLLPFVRTPHTIDWPSLARAHHLPLTSANTPTTATQALTHPITTPHLIHLHSFTP